MNSKGSKEKKDETRCCNPEQFQWMFEMMEKCFKDRGQFDCSSIMKVMKNQACCSTKEEETKTGC